MWRLQDVVGWTCGNLLMMRKEAIGMTLCGMCNHPHASMVEGALSNEWHW